MAGKSSDKKRPPHSGSLSSVDWDWIRGVSAVIALYQKTQAENRKPTAQELADLNALLDQITVDVSAFDAAGPQV